MRAEIHKEIIGCAIQVEIARADQGPARRQSRTGQSRGKDIIVQVPNGRSSVAGIEEQVIGKVVAVEIGARCRKATCFGCAYIRCGANPHKSALVTSRWIAGFSIIDCPTPRLGQMRFGEATVVSERAEEKVLHVVTISETAAPIVREIETTTKSDIRIGAACAFGEDRVL